MSKIYTFNPEDSVELSTSLNLRYGNKDYPIGNFGELGFISGERESRKSTFARTLCAAAILDGKPVCGYYFKDFGQRDILYVDTEQADALVKSGGMRMLKQIGVKKVPSNFKMVALSSLPSSSEKMEKFQELVHKLDNPGLVILDNPRDLLKNANDMESSKRLADTLNSLCINHNCMVIGISHYASGSTKLFGTIGTFLNDTSSFGFGLIKINTYTIVYKKKGRYGEFPSTEFGLDKVGVPFAGDYVPFPVTTK